MLATIQRHTMLGITGLVATGFAVRGLAGGPVHNAWKKLGTDLTIEDARATVNGLSPTRKVGEAGGYLVVAAMFAAMSVLLTMCWIPPVA